MSFNDVLVTGDCHGQIANRIERIWGLLPQDEVAMIFLGDFGANYYGGKKDYHNKELISSYGYTLYALRGNHEMRPSTIPTMKRVYDDFVHGYVWMEDDFPLIRYFEDCVAEYNILGYNILTIPGAYSVDKYYRLERGFSWFPDEQLTKEEMNNAYDLVKGKHYDFVFSHTCPISWMPFDLFISGVNQSTVDNTMEIWMEDLKSTYTWGHHLFGHYHADRLERPNVHQLYTSMENLHTLAKYNNELYREKSPNFYMGA